MALGHLVAEEIAKFVYAQLGTDCGAGWESWRDVWVAVADCDVFQDVAFVEHVDSPARSQNFISPVALPSGLQPCPLKIADNLLRLKLDPNHNLRLLMRDHKLALANIRRQHRMIPIDNLHRLDLERHLTVLRESPDKSNQTDHRFRSAQGCHLDEDVLCIH